MNSKIVINPTELRDKTLSKHVKLGLIGVTSLFVGVAGFYALSLLWLGTGDSPRHLDYVWQVSQGQLPRYEDGIQYEPMRDMTRDIGQHVSHHPPLFYILIAPFVKGYLETGEWHKAVAVGRIVSILIGILTVIAASWAGWMFGGTRKELFAVALPLVVVFQQAFLRVSGDIRGDGLVTLFSILTCTILYKSLKEGLKRKEFVGLILVSILGMASRASYIATLITAIFGIFLIFFLHERQRKKAIMRGFCASAVVLLSVLISSGWFYYSYNFKRTGSWIGSVEGKLLEWLMQVREYKTLPDVILNLDLYRSALHVSDGILEIVAGLVTVTLLVSCLLFFRKNRHWQKFRKDKPTMIIVTLLALQFIVAFYGQVKHAVGYGQLSSRYFLLSLFPVALLLAYGLLSRVSHRGQLLIAYTIFQIVTFFIVHDEHLRTRTMYDVIKLNGVPVFIPIILIIIAFCGLFLVSRSIFILSSFSKKTE